MKKLISLLFLILATVNCTAQNYNDAAGTTNGTFRIGNTHYIDFQPNFYVDNHDSVRVDLNGIFRTLVFKSYIKDTLSKFVKSPILNDSNYIPLWDGINSKRLKNGLPFTSLATPSTVVTRNGYGDSYFRNVYASGVGELASLKVLNLNTNQLLYYDGIVRGVFPSVGYVYWNGTEYTFQSSSYSFTGTGIIKSTAGTITYLTDNSANWNTAYSIASSISSWALASTKPSYTASEVNAQPILNGTGFVKSQPGSPVSYDSNSYEIANSNIQNHIGTTITPHVTATEKSRWDGKQDAINQTGLVKGNLGSPISYVTDNSANWNTAYGWGNHAGLYAATNQTMYIGTTGVAINRSSASLSLTGVSIDGNAGTVTNGVYTNGSYSNPSWISSLSDTKVLPAMGGLTNYILSNTGTNSVWREYLTISQGGTNNQTYTDGQFLIATTPGGGTQKFSSSGYTSSSFATSGHNHSGVYESANSNIQTHIGTTGTPHVTQAEKNTWNSKQDVINQNGIVRGNLGGAITYITDNSSNWNTAYSWGNHAGLYASLSGSYSDPSWIASLAGSKVSQSSSYRLVTDTEKNTWNSKLSSYTETDPTIYTWAKASTKPSYTYSEVGAEAANSNIQNHIGTTGTPHVTSTEKSNWNNKQDQINQDGIVKGNVGAGISYISGKSITFTIEDGNLDNWTFVFTNGVLTSLKKNGTEQ